MNQLKSVYFVIVKSVLLIVCFHTHLDLCSAGIAIWKHTCPKERKRKLKPWKTLMKGTSVGLEKRSDETQRAVQWSYRFEWNDSKIYHDMEDLQKESKVFFWSGLVAQPLLLSCVENPIMFSECLKTITRWKQIALRRISKFTASNYFWKTFHINKIAKEDSVKHFLSFTDTLFNLCPAICTDST